MQFFSGDIPRVRQDDSQGISTPIAHHQYLELIIDDSTGHAEVYFVLQLMKRSLAYFWEGQEASSKWWASWSAGWFPNLEKKLIESGAPPPSKIKIIQVQPH